MTKIVLFLGILIVVSGCAQKSLSRKELVHGPGTKTARKIDSGSQTDGTGQSWVGMASYYADKFHGRKTANGEVFDMNGRTAAHRELPFGTILKVTNLSNGKTCVVRVNDRGPFVKGRMIDLSLGAAKTLGMVQAGVAEVRIEVMTMGNE